MLFCPPQAPVQLRPRGTVIVGRSRSCDLRLPEGDASRRHAEITGNTQGFTLFDLGSTNGTYVNGERVQERRLEPGDRIQIGGSAITFCQVGGGLENVGLDCDSEQTILRERSVTGEVFEGDLGEIPPFAVLQILEMGRKTGVLQCESERGVGRIWLSCGAPIHAETESQSGFDAGLVIVNSSKGRFTFRPDEDPPELTIETSLMELLLEASRALDEGLL